MTKPIEQPDSVHESRPYILKVFRMKPKSRVIIRTLADAYKGCLTHYYADRTQYCGFPEFPCSLHKLPEIWRGYTAVECWDNASGFWFPACLEITEHLEQDFQGKFARGQQWVLSTGEKVGKKNPPVFGHFLNNDPSLNLRRAFPITAVVQHLYHRLDLVLDKDNPMPPRTILQATEGEAPVVLKTEPMQAATPEEREAFRAALGKAIKARPKE